MFDIPWRDLWAHRDLILLLARRDLTTSYKQTVLGPLWFVFQPVLITAVFSYLFGRMARFGTDDIPHFLFYMSGLVIWSFFAECVNKCSRTFLENQHIFSRVYYPRLVAPLAAVLTNMVPFAVHFGIFLLGWAFYLAQDSPFLHPNWRIVLLPLILLQVAMLGMGIGCSVAALTKRFRDLVFGIQVGLQLWMLGSAIVFPLSRIAPDDRWPFFLNPIVPFVESFRRAFFGVSLIEPRHVIYGAVVSIAVMVLGLGLFNRAEQTSMDTV